MIHVWKFLLLHIAHMTCHDNDSCCLGNDISGYRTTMPVIHTATHLGPHPVLGPPSGKTASWYGVPNTFIRNIGGQWK